MKFHRSWAIFLRYFYVFSKFDQLAELFYWPAVDIVLWGMTSLWLQNSDTSVTNFALNLLSGLVFWQIMWRSNFEVGVNLLTEFWSRNLVNLFSTPLKLIDWIGGIILITLLKVTLSVGFAVLLVYQLYSLNILAIGLKFIPFALSLMVSGWWTGFLAAGIVVYWGQRLQMLAWMMAYIFSPFSAVFYPVSALPLWAQKISSYLPMSYVFEAMRKILQTDVFPMHELVMTIALNALYFPLAFTFFKYMFEKSRMKGLARLE
jgi:ABC-2 type transport system permease protein